MSGVGVGVQERYRVCFYMKKGASNFEVRKNLYLGKEHNEINKE